jgi:hypothetical protein
MNSVTDSKHTPLSAVLERREGTLRFGHALRQLGRVNNGALRDIIDELDTVQSTDQLIRILALAAQECTVASAKTQFMIVPTDEDLKYLLNDIDSFSAKTVARLLIILSALRYPHVNKEGDHAGDSSPLPISEQKEEIIL